LKMKQWDKEAGDLCVLAGSNVNQDGKSASLTAPNGPAQERVFISVLREAGITPGDIDTTECHGTGTPLGDPIEIGAYAKGMRSSKRTEPVIITSSKSNLGHCEGSAGISGFIKCVLMCMHAEGTPNCHLTGLNPHMDMEGFPGSLLTESIVMRSQASYNGVLSFGFGGTNASATVWGQNTMTSRGALGDPHKAAIKRIGSALAPEVHMTGQHWEEWTVEGDHLNGRVGDEWNVEISGDLSVSFTEKDKEQKHDVSEYFIEGSFNDWKHLKLETDSRLIGLYGAEVTIGSSGEEVFRVVAEQDAQKSFYPSCEKCWLKSGPVLGPQSPPSQDTAWCLRGAVGDRFHIEFYRSESQPASISWFRVD